jgi:hypothetical protein
MTPFFLLCATMCYLCRHVHEHTSGQAPHTLTVFQLRVVMSICFENHTQILLALTIFILEERMVWIAAW